MGGDSVVVKGREREPLTQAAERDSPCALPFRGTYTKPNSPTSTLKSVRTCARRKREHSVQARADDCEFARPTTCGSGCGIALISELATASEALLQRRQSRVAARRGEPEGTEETRRGAVSPLTVGTRCRH